MKLKLLKDLNSTIQTLIHYPHINAIFFVSLVILCFIGDFLGNLSGRIAVFYWLFMIPVFFLITLLNEKAKEFKTGRAIPSFSRSSFLFWMSALMSTLLILFVWHAGELDVKTSALAIHVIVAHTMFLIGTLAGLRFYLIGFFLFLTAGITTQFEGLMGITLLLAAPIIFAGFYYDNHHNAIIREDN